MIDDKIALSRRSFVGGSGALGLLPAKAVAQQSAPPTPVSEGNAPPIRPDQSVDRGFLRVSEGLIHYRFGGVQENSVHLPLYMAHAGPGSSLSMVGLIKQFSDSRLTVAPDMLGNGDSAPPASENTNMLYYAECVVRILDLLKIDRIDFYGSHTGAQIGCELAVKWPDRVRRLVFDGLPLFPEDFKQLLLANYAPKVEPDEFGGHLLWTWNFVRDQSLYWPHFLHDADHRLANGLASPRDMHLGVIDVLKALDTYRIAYQAAFAQNVADLLPRIKSPVLLMAIERDPLHFYLDDVARLLPRAQKILFKRASNPNDRIAAIRSFLDS
jgi:pimeloyl-ACP methyl ester carboxylesterase